MGDGFGGDGFIGVGEADNGDPPDDAGYITLQTSSGLSDANSYVDIAYLYAYADQVGYQIADGETGASVEQAILRAMPHTEARQAEFFGRRSTSTQMTAFPRTGSYGDHQRTSFIPDEIKKAQAAYALAELSFDAATDIGQIHSGTIKKKREKIGEIEREYEYSSATAIQTDYGHAKAKGDFYIQMLVSNSVALRTLSYPLWTGAQ